MIGSSHILLRIGDFMLNLKGPVKVFEMDTGNILLQDVKRIMLIVV